MTKRKHRIVAVVLAALLFICMYFAMFMAVVFSGVASYGASYWMLTQYAEGTNEYIQYLEKTCEKKPPARKGKSHAKPEWTGYFDYD